MNLSLGDNYRNKLKSLGEGINTDVNLEHLGEVEALLKGYKSEIHNVLVVEAANSNRQELITKLIGEREMVCNSLDILRSVNENLDEGNEKRGNLLMRLKIMLVEGYKDVSYVIMDEGNYYRKVKLGENSWGRAEKDGNLKVTLENVIELSDIKKGNFLYKDTKLKRGMMNINGEVIHKAEYSNAKLLDNGYAVIENPKDSTINNKLLLNDKGELVINSGFYDIGLDSYGLISVKRFENNEIKCGRYTLDGVEIIPCDYFSISEDTGIEGVYEARKNREDSLIRKDGFVIFDSNEYFKDRKGFKHKLYDIGKFEEAKEEKVAIISISEGYKKVCGLMDENGKIRIEPKYGELYYAGDVYCGFRNYRNFRSPVEGYVNYKTGYEYIGKEAEAIKSKIERDKKIRYVRTRTGEQQ